MDVEDYDDQAPYLAPVRNATAATAAATLSLRFSATVPVWVAWAPVAGSDEGFHQQIMRAVDEVIIMDYGTAWYDRLDSLRARRLADLNGANVAATASSARRRCRATPHPRTVSRCRS